VLVSSIPSEKEDDYAITLKPSTPKGTELSGNFAQTLTIKVVDPCTMPLVTHPPEEQLPSTFEYLIEDPEASIDILEFTVLPT